MASSLQSRRAIHLRTALERIGFDARSSVDLSNTSEPLTPDSAAHRQDTRTGPGYLMSYLPRAGPCYLAPPSDTTSIRLAIRQEQTRLFGLRVNHLKWK